MENAHDSEETVSADLWEIKRAGFFSRPCI